MAGIILVVSGSPTQAFCTTNKVAARCDEEEEEEEEEEAGAEDEDEAMMD